MFFDRRIPSWLRTAYNYDSLGAVLYGMFYGLTIAFFPVIARKIGADSTQMALLTTTPFIGALFTFFWAHYSSDKKKMLFLVRTKSVARILVFAMAIAVNPTIFVTIILFYWFFEMAGMPAYVSIIKEIYSEEHRGRVLGYVRVEMALAVIVASYVGGSYLIVSVIVMFSL